MAEKIFNLIKKQEAEQNGQNILNYQLQQLQIIKTLDGQPKIESLQTLILEDNRLDGNALKSISENFKNLISLSLTNNQIVSLDELHVLTKLNNLQQLDFQNNQVEQQKDYRKKIFEMFPNLQIFDNKNKDGNNIKYSDEDINDKEGLKSDSEYNENDKDHEDEFIQQFI
ncbi:unnamed protein product [Paramecium sonneborni]|uniref:Uncharacterized protein n=1 Tax=Paramecium sonneborni TaxID=65129 RepID=A0A8S1LV94_9CILI|nr:unnamed protein product [Paramecium sonneborni]